MIIQETQQSLLGLNFEEVAGEIEKEDYVKAKIRARTMGSEIGKTKSLARY